MKAYQVICTDDIDRNEITENFSAPDFFAYDADEADKVIAHHKYKRCLNKAEWCEERCARYDLLQEHSGFSWRREIDFYFRWHCRWLELAEKFKEWK